MFGKGERVRGNVVYSDIIFLFWGCCHADLLQLQYIAIYSSRFFIHMSQPYHSFFVILLFIYLIFHRIYLAFLWFCLWYLHHLVFVFVVSFVLLTTTVVTTCLSVAFCYHHSHCYYQKKTSPHFITANFTVSRSEKKTIM